MQHNWGQLRNEEKTKKKKKDLQTDTCAHIKSGLGGLDSQLVKTQTLRSSSAQHVYYIGLNQEAESCIQLNKEAELLHTDKQGGGVYSIQPTQEHWFSSPW